jgi:predicted MPP superfamily phosphohydrolase
MFFPTLILAMSALGLYADWRLIRPLPLDWRLRLALCVFILLCANKVVLLRWLAPGGISLKLPYAVLVVTAWLHITVVLMAVTGFIGQILATILRAILNTPDWTPFLHTWRAAAFKTLAFPPPFAHLALIGILSALLAGLGIHNAVRAPDVEELRLPVRRLPADLAGFRIAFLSDLHLGPLFGEDWAQEVVRRVNEAGPDLIVFTGDIADDTPEALAPAAQALRNLRAPYGAYAVVGNHEYYVGLEAWKRAYPGVGMRLLFNEHAVIPVGSSRIVLAGLTDRVTLRGGYGYLGEKPDLDKALSGAPERDAGTLRIVLDHQPAGAAGNAAKDMDIQLSGHTHGGLVPLLQPFVARANGGFVSGRYDVNGMRLIVSNGTGLWAGMPLRLGVPGQILILNLAPAE